jgi:hypothetical protein
MFIEVYEAWEYRSLRMNARGSRRESYIDRNVNLSRLLRKLDSVVGRCRRSGKPCSVAS